MNKKESIQQIETLIEAWQLDEADLNQTDINAMQSLLKENQMLKEKFKATNKGLQKVVLKRKKWKLRYQLARCEIKELKKQLEEYKATNEVLSHELTKDKVLQQDCLTTCCGIPIGDIPKLITQQKEFIEYMNKTIEELESDNVDDEEMKGYLIQRIDTFKEILQKYKSIIGDDK